VAASTEDDELWAASNFGRSTVHLAAPGLDVPTTRRVNRYTISFNGTSSAAPHVAGAIALLAGAVPTASAEKIKEALLTSSDAVPSLAGRVMCHGRLNVARALARLSKPNPLPVVTHMEPAGAVMRTNSIVVTFSQPMNPASLEAAFTITPPVSGAFHWSQDLRQLDFVAAFARADHEVEITGMAESAAGHKLDANLDGTNNPAESFSWRFGFPVANDHFAEAQTIVGLSGTVPGTTHRASPEANEPDHADNLWSATSVWFHWVAPEDGVFIFETATSSFDTLLAVYQGGSLVILVEVASNDNAEQTRSRVSFEAQSGARYSIAVAGKSRSRDKYFVDRFSYGDFTLAWRPIGVPMMLTEFTPKSGPAGTIIALRGQNLDQATNVWIGTAAASFTSGVTRGELLVTVPPPADDGLIRLAGFYGEINSTKLFSVLPPALRIERTTPSSLTLRWGATSPEIVLETTASMPAGTWTIVTNNLIRNETGTRVEVQPSGDRRYYRLKKAP
jgi:hypothetical protein